MPSADSCTAIWRLSTPPVPIMRQQYRPPGVSRFLWLTFSTQPLNLRVRLLVNMDFVISRKLVPPWRLTIQFLFVGSYLCYTLPSDPASQQRPCASLTFTSTRLVWGLPPHQSAGMPGTRKYPPAIPVQHCRSLISSSAATASFGATTHGPLVELREPFCRS